MRVLHGLLRYLHRKVQERKERIQCSPMSFFLLLEHCSGQKDKTKHLAAAQCNLLCTELKWCCEAKITHTHSSRDGDNDQVISWIKLLSISNSDSLINLRAKHTFSLWKCHLNCSYFFSKYPLTDRTICSCLQFPSSAHSTPVLIVLDLFFVFFCRCGHNVAEKTAPKFYREENLLYCLLVPVWKGLHTKILLSFYFFFSL